MPAHFGICQRTTAFTTAQFDRFEAIDANYPGKTADSTVAIRSLDGSPCNGKAVTRDGVVSTWEGKQPCVDLGQGGDNQEDTESHGMWPLFFLPAPHSLKRPPPDVLSLQAATLNNRLMAAQFPRSCEAAQTALRSTYFVNTVPLVGFGSVIEYSTMFLARASHMGAQLVLGPQSSIAWTSSWSCGTERSLNCYFNLTGCCTALTLHGSALELPRRRNPLNLGLPGFSQFGSAWVSAQFAHFFFSRLTPYARREVDVRRAGVMPRGSPPTIGIHIRGGDSCSASRYCPKNLTATYFTQAAKFRERYGVNRILLATDNKDAAALCDARVLGFECSHISIDRSKFESETFIENRVKQNEQGPLSGTAVALDALADIDMLGDCDYLIVLLRSAVSRLALSLALARKGKMPPFASLQWPWSPNYHKRLFKMKRKNYDEMPPNTLVWDPSGKHKVEAWRMRPGPPGKLGKGAHARHKKAQFD